MRALVFHREWIEATEHGSTVTVAIISGMMTMFVVMAVSSRNSTGEPGHVIIAGNWSPWQWQLIDFADSLTYPSFTPQSTRTRLYPTCPFPYPKLVWRHFLSIHTPDDTRSLRVQTMHYWHSSKRTPWHPSLLPVRIGKYAAAHISVPSSGWWLMRLTELTVALQRRDDTVESQGT